MNGMRERRLLRRDSPGAVVGARNGAIECNLRAEAASLGMGKSDRIRTKIKVGGDDGW